MRVALVVGAGAVDQGALGAAVGEVPAEQVLEAPAVPLRPLGDCFERGRHRKRLDDVRVEAHVAAEGEFSFVVFGGNRHLSPVWRFTSDRYPFQ